MRIRYHQKDRECAPRKEIERLQLERLKALVARVYEKVPRYRRSFDAAGVKPRDIRKLADLAKLPFTTKDDLRQEFPYGMFATPMKQVVRVHSSSGTTGVPTVVGYTRRDIATWSSLTARVLAAGGMTADDIVQISFGYGLFTGAFGMHYGVERIGATVIPISTGNTLRQVTTIRDFKVTALVCTPSYALQVGDTARERGVDISGLRRGFFGAEPWSENMRREIEGSLGLFATDNYGLSEVIGPGFSGECVHRCGLHVADDHFIAEIIDPVTMEPLPEGEKGELVITPLTKEALPLVRYRTRDIASLTREPCACGRTLTRMTRITGRNDDMMIIKGVNVFPTQIEEVLFSCDGVLPQYVIVLERSGRLDSIEVQVEVRDAVFASQKACDALRKAIGSAMLAVIGISPRLTLVKANTLPRTEGKARRIIDRRAER